MTTRVSQLRRELKARRLRLTPRQQRLASLAVFLRLQRQPWYRRARHIAVYLACRGELDLAPLMQQAHRQGRTLYLPLLTPRRPSLRFVRYRPGQTLRANRFGILEPARPIPRVPRNRLDLILLPLVAFDPTGHRLGMGGGYFDRALASFRGKRHPRRIGVAYDWQRIPDLTAQPWDIPLHGAVTDRRAYRFPAR